MTNEGFIKYPYLTDITLNICPDIQVHLNKFVEKVIYFSNSTQIVKLMY